jgi:hypothetical protein
LTSTAVISRSFMMAPKRKSWPKAYPKSPGAKPAPGAPARKAPASPTGQAEGGRYKTNAPGTKKSQNPHPQKAEGAAPGKTQEHRLKPVLQNPTAKLLTACRRRGRREWANIMKIMIPTTRQPKTRPSSFPGRSCTTTLYRTIGWSPWRRSTVFRRTESR